MCWKYCVPIAAFCFLGLCAWQIWSLPSINDLAAPRMRGEVREHWAQRGVSETGGELGRIERDYDRSVQPQADARYRLQATGKPPGEAAPELAGRAG